MKSFEHKIRVEYHHTDQMGVVHHSNYVKFFEAARTEWLRAIGLTYAEMERRGVMMPIVEVNVKYKHPALYDELITVRAIVDEMPMARMVSAMRLRARMAARWPQAPQPSALSTARHAVPSAPPSGCLRC